MYYFIFIYYFNIILYLWLSWKRKTSKFGTKNPKRDLIFVKKKFILKLKCKKKIKRSVTTNTSVLLNVAKKRTRKRPTSLTIKETFQIRGIVYTKYIINFPHTCESLQNQQTARLFLTPSPFA